MDAVPETIEDEKPKLLDQFAKYALGIVAAFAASQLVEKAYDKFIVERRKDYIEEINE